MLRKSTDEDEAQFVAQNRLVHKTAQMTYLLTTWVHKHDWASWWPIKFSRMNDPKC